MYECLAPAGSQARRATGSYAMQVSILSWLLDRHCFTLYFGSRRLGILLQILVVMRAATLVPHTCTDLSVLHAVYAACTVAGCLLLFCSCRSCVGVLWTQCSAWGSVLVTVTKMFA